MNARTQQTQSHSQEQQGEGEQNKAPRYQEFQVKLSSGEIFYLLALNSMNAAYSALELSIDRNCKLLDVSLTDEW
tara:strand:+ start:862 stop:1086 length:225 start_codon:yes stop_codon:yes gene_type:complete